MLYKRSNALVQLLLASLFLVTLIGGGTSRIFVYNPNLVSASEATSSHQTDLLLGKSILLRLEREQVQTLKVTLTSDQFLQILVECDGRTQISVLRANEQNLLTLACRLDGPTPVPLLADVSGEYRLQLRLTEGVNANVKLTAEQPREATTTDRQRAMAAQLSAEAELLLKEWSAQSSASALTKFQSSFELSKSIGDKQEAGHTLSRIGDVRHPLGDYQQALAAYEQSLSITRELRDGKTEAATLNKLGFVYIILGETKKAEELCARALALNRTHKYARGEAQSLANLGEVAYGLGKLTESLALYDQALKIWREKADREGEAAVLLNAGYTHSDLAQVREAIDAYSRALALWEQTGNLRGQALALSAIGKNFSRTGQSQKALEHFTRAMELIRRFGDPIEEARTLNGMAYLYHRLGDHQRALSYYDQSLPLFKSARYANGEASTLGDMGRVYHAMGEYEKALSSHEYALAIFKSVGDRRMEIVEVKEIGRVLDSKGDHVKARASYQTAREFYHSQNDLRGEATTLNLLGKVYEKLGNNQQALESYRTAQMLAEQAEDPFARSASLYNIAHLERDSGNFADARSATEKSIAIIESLRTDVGNQDLRASYFASVRDHYELYIDVLMQLHRTSPSAGYANLAFEVSEQARARSLLELLKEARTNIREGADTSLLERERSLQQQLTAKTERRMRLLSAREGVEAALIAKEIDQLVVEYDALREQIRKTSPRYAALTQPQSLKLSEVQQQILDDDSLLLEYLLGEKRSYVWAVSKNKVASFELPGRAEIEKQARHFYDRLTQVTRADELAAAGVALSDTLLGPVADELTRKRILLVADGALQYVPFQALHAPHETSPMVAKHEIVNEPSASILALVLREQPTRSISPKTIAVFADPVFETDDPRVKKGKSNSQTAVAAATDPPTTLRDAQFFDNELKVPRLQASRDEAEAIMNIVPPDSGLKAMNFDASRATVMRANLGQYRFVHFATHGLLNQQNPEFSGIVLSMVDQKGQSQNGFLQLYDIYNLELPVDFVVLSACNSALGKDVRGEGLIGLTRGFMYAGASGVVASLWKVDDDATAELMKHFYSAVFKKRLSPAAALRDAQLAMQRHRRWQSPYYWSGFIIQGQYRETIELSQTTGGRARYLIIGLGICSLIVATFLLLGQRRGRVI